MTAVDFNLGFIGQSHSLTAAPMSGSVTLTASDTGPGAFDVGGSYAITGGGAVLLQHADATGANVTQSGTLTIAGGSVVVGDIALAQSLSPLVGSGDVTLTANGPLATDSVTAGVVTARNAVKVTSAHGDVTLGGATSGTEGATAHDVSVSAVNGSAAVIGDVISMGDYTVMARGIAVGSAAAGGVVQQAVGNVLIRSDTNIYASGTLVADSADLPGLPVAPRLVLDASSGGLFNSATGPVNLAAGPATQGGNVLLSFANGHDVALGTVTANAFSTATPVGTPMTVADYTPSVVAMTTPSLSIVGALSTGAITVVQSLDIGSTDPLGSLVSLGSVTSAMGSVHAFSQNGSLTVGPVSAKTFAALDAANTLTVGDVTANGGDATLTGVAAITTAGSPHTIHSSHDVVLKSDGAINVDAVTAGHSVTAQGFTGSNAGSFDGTTVTATSGSVEVTTSGDITLSGTVTAGTFATLAASGTLTIGDVAANGGDATLSGKAAITTTGGGRTISASHDVLLNSDGAIQVGAVSAGHSVTVAGFTGSSALSFSGTSITATTGDVAATTANDINLTTAGLTITSGGNVALTSTGGAVTVPGLTAVGNILLDAHTAAAVLGNVTAGSGGSGDYTVKGATVAVGAAGTTQKARGNVWILSRTGGLTLSGTLIADDGGASGIGTGTSKLVLDSAGVIGGGVDGPASLTAGAGAAASASNRDPILIRLANLAQPVTLGAIDGRSLELATATNPTSVSSYGPATANSFVTTGTVTLGPVATIASNTIGSNGTSPGTGNVAVGGDTSLTGAVTLLSSQGALGVGGAVAARNDVTVSAAAKISATAVRAGGGITANVTNSDATATFTADSLQANGAIDVNAVGNITLAGLHAPSGTVRKAIDADLSGFHGTPTAASADLTLTSTGDNGTATVGSVSAAALQSTGNLTINAVSSAAVTNVVTIGDGLTASNSGNFNVTVTKGPLTLGGTGVVQSATGTIALAASGPIAVDTLLAGGAIMVQGLTPTTGLATFNAMTLQANGGITVAANGDITLTGTGMAQSATERPGFDPVLRTFSITTVPALPDADVRLTSPGTITVPAAASTGNLVFTAGQGIAAGTLTAGDTTNTPPTGSITLTGYGLTTLASGSAQQSITVRSSNDAAVLTYGSAARGDIDVAGLTAATITQGTATLGNVRASAASGLATIGDATAGQSVIANGPSAVVTTAKAGDDIVLVGGSGDVTATTLTVTGAAATETPAADANGNPLMFGGATLTGLGSGGSNVIIRATGTATIGGDVSIAQSNAAKTADYDVRAGSITLGTTGMALNQAAAGRVDLVSTTGGVTFANTGGTLSSNVGGMRIASADASTAAAGLSIASATGIAGAGTALVAAQTADASAGPDRQLRQPGIVLSAAPGGNGSVAIGSITGGAVTVTAPGTIAITGLSGGPGITATGDVSLTGVATAGNDTAVVAPVAIVIDGVNPTSSYGRVNVTAAGGGTVGGPGAEIASLGVVNGGQVGALQVLSDTGAATLRATPTDPARIVSILVESQTGTAGILAPGGGAVTVAAQTITLRGRQNGSIVLANEPLLATGSVLATGPTVTLGTVQINGTAADGTGDLVVAATGAASLAAAASETAVARHSLTVTGGTVVLGDGTATGGTLALGGTNGVTIARRAVAGDDLVVTSGGSVVATNAALTTTGSTDLQGDDNAGLTTATVGTFPAGAGYGLKYGSVLADVAAPVYDTATAGALNHLFNSNIVVTAANNIDLGAATLTATAGRDVHVEAGGTVNLIVGQRGAPIRRLQRRYLHRDRLGHRGRRCRARLGCRHRRSQRGTGDHGRCSERDRRSTRRRHPPHRGRCRGCAQQPGRQQHRARRRRADPARRGRDERRTVVAACLLGRGDHNDRADRDQRQCRAGRHDGYRQLCSDRRRRHRRDRPRRSGDAERNADHQRDGRQQCRARRPRRKRHRLAR